jgi:hypothetical protein
MTAERTLPWLQTVPQTNVWQQWKVTFRDVRVLDASNRLFGVYNLTQHDLSFVENRDALKSMLIAAAFITDADADGLPDHWELKYFGNLAAKPTDDPDGDGFTNLMEFAWGADPTDPKSKPGLDFGITRDGRFNVGYYRWSGGVFKYLMEASKDCRTWDGSAASVRYGPPANLYDGTGRARVVFYTAKSPKTELLNFLRVKAIR